MYKYETKNYQRIILIAFVVLTFSGPHAYASISGKVNDGNRLFSEGDYQGAQAKYDSVLQKKPESDIINFNIGTNYYKLNDYTNAIKHLQKALLSEDESLKEKALYNLGNSMYRSGIAKEREDIEFAISSLEKALKFYESALEIDSEDEDTQFNYEFVKKELERLKQQQEQQQQQDQQNQDQQNQDQQNQSQQNQSESQQSDSTEQNNQQQDSKSQENQSESQEQSQDDSSDEQSDQGEQEQENQQNTGDQNEEERQGEFPQRPQPVNAEELTKEEAEMLLNSYEQTEEPRELLQFIKPSAEPRPVTKDW